MAAACGSYFTAIVTEQGEVFAWGRGDEGQLGLEAGGTAGHQHTPSFVGGVAEFDGTRIVQPAAGFQHTAAVADDGALWTWGCGVAGRLGHGDKQQRLRPTRLGREAFGGSPVVKVACGWQHTIAMTGEVDSENKVKKCASCESTTGLKYCKRCESALYCSPNCQIKHWQEFNYLCAPRPDGSVWMCGLNENGQLGLGDTVERLSFTIVRPQKFGGLKIVEVACGAFHSVVISADGVVWSWGCGKYGCLGLGDEHDRLVPEPLGVERFQGSKMVKLAAGAGHTVALGADGVLWAWGYGRNGALGLGDKRKRMVPNRIEVDAFGRSRVLMVSCGHAHTLAVTEERQLVYSWGLGLHGRLGHKDEISRLAPTNLDANHFGNLKIASIAGGEEHSVALAENGALYTWGRGATGHCPAGLGHADLQDKLVPTLVLVHSAALGLLSNGTTQQSA